MWVNRAIFQHLITSMQYLQGVIAQRDLALEAAEDANANWIAANASLRERLIAAEGKARGSAALADAFTIRLNQVQAERDQLFARVLDPNHRVEIRTPIVGNMGRVAPDANLFHDPSELESEAREFSDEIPMEAATEAPIDGGLVGEVFRDPREQGL